MVSVLSSFLGIDKARSEKNYDGWRVTDRVCPGSTYSEQNGLLFWHHELLRKAIQRRCRTNPPEAIRGRLKTHEILSGQDIWHDLPGHWWPHQIRYFIFLFIYYLLQKPYYFLFKINRF